MLAPLLPPHQVERAERGVEELSFVAQLETSSDSLTDARVPPEGYMVG